MLLARASKTLADYFVWFVLQLELISIDSKIALDAVIFANQYHLPMADALIYASATDRNAKLIASDSRFKEVPGVTLI